MLFQDGVTLQLHQVDWTDVRLLKEGSGEEPYHYYGRLKGFKFENKNLKKDPVFMQKASLQAFYINREIWIMIIKYCRAKSIPLINILVTSRITAKMLLAFLTSDKKRGQTVLNLGAALTALNVNHRELLRWYAQTMDYGGLDPEEEIQKMIEEVEFRASIVKKKVLPVVATPDLKTMKAQGVGVKI